MGKCHVISLFFQVGKALSDRLVLRYGHPLLTSHRNGSRGFEAITGGVDCGDLMYAKGLCTSHHGAYIPEVVEAFKDWAQTEKALRQWATSSHMISAPLHTPIISVGFRERMTSAMRSRRVSAISGASDSASVRGVIPPAVILATQAPADIVETDSDVPRKPFRNKQNFWISWSTGGKSWSSATGLVEKHPPLSCPRRASSWKFMFPPYLKTTLEI